MSTEENKQITEPIIEELFNRGNAATAEDSIHPEFVDYSPPPMPDFPTAGVESVLAAVAPRCVVARMAAPTDLIRLGASQLTRSVTMNRRLATSLFAVGAYSLKAYYPRSVAGGTRSLKEVP